MSKTRYSGSNVSDMFVDSVVQIPHVGITLASDLVDEGLRVLYKAVFNQDMKKEEKEDDKNTIPSEVSSLTGMTFGHVASKWKKGKVYFPPLDYRHKIVLGCTGAGKTFWAINYVVNCDHGCAYLDNADGEAIDRILERLPEERLKKTVVLDHYNKKFPLPIGVIPKEYRDVFHSDAVVGSWVSFFEANFNIDRLYRTSELIAYSCKLAFSVEGTTFFDVIRIVKDGRYRKYLIRRLDRTNHRDIIEWWNTFDGYSDGKKVEIVSAFLHRAEVLFRDRMMRYTLGQMPKNLDYRKWMDEGYTVLIKAPETLGEMSVRIIMAIHALSFWQAALTRDDIQKEQRTPFTLIGDEPQSWLFNNSTTIDNIFSKARKYGFGMICLFQSFDQIASESPALMKTMIANSPDLLVFRTSKKQLDIKEWDVETLPSYHFVGRVKGSKYFMAKAPAPAKKLRGWDELNKIYRENRERFNLDYKEIDSTMERRMYLCRDEEETSTQEKSQLESQKSGSIRTSDLLSQNETEKSSNSSVMFG